ncbi:MAG: PadR family transcriptional regulator [Geodermatophilaceae bacterium]|nr:PadR family transcriptional regulator [Geodermatophilaceae bacterium]MDQ3455320.1 PadR family transcriptional regulator [Actinomycetota bacterium]
MVAPSPTTYGLLGMLAARSWTGYELTQQVRRSLRFVWPASEGHLYREQRRLVDLGWAAVEQEAAGQRSRNRYTITATGRSALRDWLATEPEEPHFQIEGVLRTFFGDQGSREELGAAMRATAGMARSMLEEMAGFAAEYLEEGGPLWMLERGVGEAADGPLHFHGRPMFPERLHVVALAMDVTTRLLHDVERFFAEVSREVARWPDRADVSMVPATRARLERIRSRTVEPQ